MIVIADTSPVHYAVAINAGAVLFALYGRIAIPPAVFAELGSEGAPEVLRAWLISSRDRIDVIAVAVPDDPRLGGLDAGEREAIVLAEGTAGSLLIIDEREGREEAARRGIAITGLLGVLRDAGLRGLIDFEECLRKLKATDFRLSAQVENDVRQQYLGGRK